MKTFRVLNLGAGIGSTAVFLLAHLRQIEPYDAAIFADVGEEPKAVYAHLEWLKTLGPRILIGSAGKLGDHLINGTNSLGQGGKHGRFAAIPAFNAALSHERRGGQSSASCDTGRVRRQCTKEYKVDVGERVIRREILGLHPRQRMPADVQVVQAFGISDDEGYRSARIRRRFAEIRWAEPEFPLLKLGWTRDDCVAFLKEAVPHEVPRSACVFCPFKGPSEWLDLKRNDPEGWARAVEIDAAIRNAGPHARDVKGVLYLHRSCLPLPMVDIEGDAAKEAARPKQPDMFRAVACDEGMCGL